MKLYEIIDLQKDFKQLAEVNKIALVPLFDTFHSHIISDLVNNPSKYNVSDGRSGALGNIYLAIDGKVMELDLNYQIMNVYKDDYECFMKAAWWRMTAGIRFEGDDSIIDEFYKTMREFVQKQNLDTLINETKEKLEKGKRVECLRKEIYDFYFSGEK